MSLYKSMLLFGAPGSGKGTQGAILGRIPGFYHCSCGDVFRSIDLHSDLGKVFYEYSSRGELVPDEVTVQMWAKVIHAHSVLSQYKPHVDLLILDGIPRTLRQAELMDEHIEVLKIVHLECDNEEEMFDRLRKRALKANRHDDADERVIRNRWKVYEEETAPVLDHYPSEKIISVNSLGSPAEILHDILEVVTPIQQEHFAAFSG
ncbi:adenylate kinase family protein [Mucisphaera calidilacus]|uniref:Adenylate kinase n=1 Tax=Mucisphaera calidilacus TaxID=2527982 RepID=A0A518C1B8_9BACT|nr:nucleoside monophosphate kinase [Mucisphaera calidilacus]QDU73008.1 Adenylate kinase [Mucisphaera calidilacus]